MKRRQTEAAPTIEPVADSTAVDLGKGRPTPKRRDVVGQRGPVVAPKTRKEAYARQKQQAKEAKAVRRATGRSQTPAERRAALRSGAVLPRRDQGESRRLARDYVDTHRMFSNYLLWLFPLMIASYVIPAAWIVQIVIVATFVGLLGEWYVTGRKLRRIAIERFGSADGGPMTLGFYAGSRAYLPRRWRMPTPQKQLGEQF